MVVAKIFVIRLFHLHHKILFVGAIGIAKSVQLALNQIIA